MMQQKSLFPSNFRDFYMSMTPEKAQQQINDMLQSGQITQNQLEEAKKMASFIMSIK